MPITQQKQWNYRYYQYDKQQRATQLRGTEAEEEKRGLFSKKLKPKKGLSRATRRAIYW